MEKETVEHHLDSAVRSSTSDHEAGVDLVYEKKLIRKVDWKLLPILSALYSVALIDRTNMSSAAVAGMSKDLELHTADRYSIVLLIFFVPYFIFELPSNIVLRRVGAATWLSSIVMAWGVVTIGMGFVKDWRVLTVCRAIVGFFEAGFFPACVYLVSCWYVRFEVQQRMAAFYLLTVLVGGFSSILAYGLTQLDGKAGIAGWRWLFIVEGILTCVLAAFSYSVIIDFPDKVLSEKNGSFLSESDVQLIKARIDRDRNDSTADPLTWAKIGKTLSDLKIWSFAILFMCQTVPAYAFAFFMPIILEGMGYSAGMSQLLSAPPYVFAVVSGMAFAFLADKMRMRGPVIVAQSVICIMGLAITAYAKGTGPRYFGTFLGIAGTQGNVPAVLSYQSNNIRTNSRRAVSSALQVGFGAIGGIYASTVFKTVDAPRYVNGLWATMACQFFTIVVIAIMSLYFRRQNARQRRGEVVLEGDEKFTYTL